MTDWIKCEGWFWWHVLTFAVRHYYGIWSECQGCKNICKYFCQNFFPHYTLIGIVVDISRYTFNAMFINPFTQKCQKHFSKMSDLAYVTSGGFDSMSAIWKSIHGDFWNFVNFVLTHTSNFISCPTRWSLYLYFGFCNYHLVSIVLSCIAFHCIVWYILLPIVLQLHCIALNHMISYVILCYLMVFNSIARYCISLHC